MTQAIYLSLKTDEAEIAFRKLTSLWDNHPAGSIITERLMDFIETALGHDFENDHMKIQFFEQNDMFEGGITEIEGDTH